MATLSEHRRKAMSIRLTVLQTLDGMDIPADHDFDTTWREYVDINILSPALTVFQIKLFHFLHELIEF
jgi:hypothetical protein